MALAFRQPSIDIFCYVSFFLSNQFMVNKILLLSLITLQEHSFSIPTKTENCYRTDVKYTYLFVGAFDDDDDHGDITVPGDTRADEKEQENWT